MKSFVFLFSHFSRPRYWLKATILLVLVSSTPALTSYWRECFRFFFLFLFFRELESSLRLFGALYLFLWGPSFITFSLMSYPPLLPDRNSIPATTTFESRYRIWSLILATLNSSINPLKESCNAFETPYKAALFKQLGKPSQLRKKATYLFLHILNGCQYDFISRQRAENLRKNVILIYPCLKTSWHHWPVSEIYKTILNSTYVFESRIKILT